MYVPTRINIFDVLPQLQNRDYLTEIILKLSFTRWHKFLTQAISSTEMTDDVHLALSKIWL